MAKIIGIDLGTSNTAAAVMEGGRGTIIPSAEGSSIGGKIGRYRDDGLFHRFAQEGFGIFFNFLQDKRR